MISIDRYNAAFCRIKTDKDIASEIKDYFTFEIDGAKYHPLVKAKKWDGKMSLFNVAAGMLPNGLIPHLEQFSKERGYGCTLTFKDSNSVTLEEISEFVESLNLSSSDGKPMKARDYQIQSVYDAIKTKRMILLSPTSSGKSLIIYCVIRWLIESDIKTLIVVPNVSLINQLHSDFKDYSMLNKWDVEKNLHKISAGIEKDDKTKLCHLSTWQSIYKQDKQFFTKFDAVVVDEVHMANGKSVSSMMEKCTNAWYRIGLTGTIDVRGQKVKTNKLVLQGLFGFIKQVITTKQLMDNGTVASLDIKVLNLVYPDEFRSLFGKQEYADELNYIVTNENRNKLIAKLAISQNKNTLVLTQFVDKQAKPIYELVKKLQPDRHVYLIIGEVDGEERERIRKTCESEIDAIIIGTYGCLSTGVSIKNLHYYISASPSKSVVRVLQSIGRILRTTKGKDSAVLFDIADDISFNKKKNTTQLHLIERLKIYAAEKFKFKITDIPFKN